jgi:glucose-1-phosphate adenylyltransferase
VLLGLLQARAEAVDLVTQHFTPMLQTHRVQAYLFNGYWQDLGSIRTYHEANLALARERPPFDFHVPDGVIYTRARNLPAAQVRASHLEATLISDGCDIGYDTHLERCVIGQRARVGRGVTMRDTVANGSDRYETPPERSEHQDRGDPPIGVGDGSVITRAILDKDCRIGANVRILNERGLREAEGDNYVIRDGIVIIPKAAVVKDGTVI